MTNRIAIIWKLHIRPHQSNIHTGIFTGMRPHILMCSQSARCIRRCCSTRISTASIASALFHRCPVRYRLVERAQSNGRPLCPLCGNATLQFVGSSHSVCIVDSSRKSEYTKLFDPPSLIVEIHGGLIDGFLNISTTNMTISCIRIQYLYSSIYR